MRFLLVACIMLAGCTPQSSQEVGTYPASLQLVPPSYYSRFPKSRSYPANRPNRPTIVDRPVVVRERPPESLPSVSPGLDEKIEGVQLQIDTLREELKK